MKPCEEYALLLDAYIDGELSSEDQKQIEAHLAECPACRAYAEDIRAMQAAFPRPEEEVLPEDFAAHVMAAIKAGAPERKKSPWGKVLAPLAACLAILLAVGGLRNSDTAVLTRESAAPSAAPAAPSAAPAAADAAWESVAESFAPDAAVEYPACMEEAAEAAAEDAAAYDAAGLNSAPAAVTGWSTSQTAREEAETEAAVLPEEAPAEMATDKELNSETAVASAASVEAESVAAAEKETQRESLLPREALETPLLRDRTPDGETADAWRYDLDAEERMLLAVQLLELGLDAPLPEPGQPVYVMK